jgi:hypothetical protein
LSAVADQRRRKQSILPLRGAMDCFASLAMTGLGTIFFQNALPLTLSVSVRHFI